MSDASSFDPETPLPTPPEPRFKVPRPIRKAVQVVSLLIAVGTAEIVRVLLLFVLCLPVRFMAPLTIIVALAELHVAAVAHRNGRDLLTAEALGCLLATGLLAYGLPRFYRRLQAWRSWDV